jgi:hypothetical protein
MQCHRSREIPPACDTAPPRCSTKPVPDIGYKIASSGRPGPRLYRRAGPVHAGNAVSCSRHAVHSRSRTPAGRMVYPPDTASKPFMLLYPACWRPSSPSPLPIHYAVVPGLEPRLCRARWRRPCGSIGARRFCSRPGGCSPPAEHQGCAYVFEKSVWWYGPTVTGRSCRARPWRRSRGKGLKGTPAGPAPGGFRGCMGFLSPRASWGRFG